MAQQAVFATISPVSRVAKSIMNLAGECQISSVSHQILPSGDVSLVVVVHGANQAVEAQEKWVREYLEIARDFS